MVFRKKSTAKRPFKRRGAKRIGRSRKRLNYAPRMGANRVKEIIPKFYSCKLTYFSQELGSTSTTTPVAHNFVSNGMYDPDLTGGGHQPRGFDQLAYLFANYKVNAVKVTLTAQLQSQTQYGYVGLAFNNHNITSVGSLEEMKEAAKWTTRNLDHENKVVIKKYMKISSIEGITDLMYRANQDLYAAGVAANPVVQPLIVVAWQHTDEASAFQPYVQLKIDYYCNFYNRVNIGSS